MDATYTVRPAGSADIAAIMQVEEKSFADGIREQEAVFADRLACAEGCNYVLAEADSGAVCGYFTAEMWDAEEIDDDAFALGHSVRERHCTVGTVLYISSFALVPELRGKKIIQTSSRAMPLENTQPVSASKLLFSTAIKNITAVFPQLERIILLVHEDWRKAIRIYESYGFVRTNVLQDFGGFGDRHAFIYEKPAV